MNSIRRRLLRGTAQPTESKTTGRSFNELQTKALMNQIGIETPGNGLVVDPASAATSRSNGVYQTKIASLIQEFA